ncbi:MAG: ribonuclease J [Candidatus Phytoplasma pyri]|uniref:ribonuclease J n=1 Tax=Candidatus Phytoplasma pyri TaxID=47566 RepID=UPI00398384A7
MKIIHPKANLQDFDIFFCALGGLGEVGKNMYIFEIEKNIFIVDAGILFSDNILFGVNYVIPNYEYLLENENRIVGLFVTHGHEDHIGSIPYLLKKVKIPKIFVSGIAYDLLEIKLLEHKDIVNNLTKIEKYNNNSKYKFGNTEISFVRLNHSIPDMFGIIFKTKNGNIFHTGDFKIDYTPVGPGAEYEKLTEIQKEGVLCLLSDSTNAEKEELIQSENKIGESINDLFSQITGRIIIVTFASNFYRIKQIIESTIFTKRKLAVFGRSMEKTIETGKKNGYFKISNDLIINNNNINKYNDITLLCTGSQGEPLAALSRIANNTHKQIKLNKGDTVIFSSSPIPGNQDSINKIIDLLLKIDINVITHGPLINTHTSGHGSQNDLKLILSLVKPKYFIPIHGEHRMLTKHKQLAIDCGVLPENILILDNGQLVGLNSQKIELLGRLPAGNIQIDGSGVGDDIGNLILKERRTLSEEGLLSVIITIDYKKKKVLNFPMIISRGFIYMKGNQKLIRKISLEIKQKVEEVIQKQDIIKLYLKKIIIDYLTSYIYELTLRNPIIVPIILNI